jgi:uncharacterized protein
LSPVDEKNLNRLFPGIFHPSSAIGELVMPGALLGTVTEYFGATIAELRAPVRGIVLMLNYTPPVASGDNPVTIVEW